MSLDVTSLFVSLPVEILDIILSNIDTRRDLLSLASSCKLLAQLAIPRHLEYRALHLSTKLQDVWTHLAERADLARNIQILQMVEDSIYLSSVNRYPTTLVPKSDYPVDKGDERLRSQNVKMALRNMSSLQKFVWVQPWASGLWPKASLYHNDILQVLGESNSLKDLSIIDTSGDADILCESSPLWHIEGLQSLLLGGFLWSRLKNHTHLASMLSRSPNLQSLTLSIVNEPPDFWSCQFPYLRTFALTGNIFSQRSCDDPILRFLEAHPSIEDLTWYPLDSESKLTLGSLPRLKRLSTSHDFAISILHDPSVPQREMECISRIVVNPSILPVLERIENVVASKLRQLSIGQYDTLESIHRLSEIFPGITTLDITRFGTLDRSDWNSGYTLDDYIDAISCFSSLKHLPDLNLWAEIQRLNSEKMQDTVCRLAQACPHLERLGVWDSVSKMAVDVVLTREARYGRVAWVQQPRLR